MQNPDVSVVSSVLRHFRLWEKDRMECICSSIRQKRNQATTLLKTEVLEITSILQSGSFRVCECKSSGKINWRHFQEDPGQHYSAVWQQQRLRTTPKFYSAFSFVSDLFPQICRRKWREPKIFTAFRWFLHHGKSWTGDSSWMFKWQNLLRRQTWYSALCEYNQYGLFFL